MTEIIGTRNGQLFLGGNLDALAADGTDQFFSFNGKSTVVTTEGRARQVLSRDGILKNVFVSLQVAPGAGKSRTFTVMVNGGASALTVTISDTDTEGSDQSNQVSVSQFDTVSIRSDGGVGTPAQTRSAVTTEFIPSQVVN